jgi:hypothetical protein
MIFFDYPWRKKPSCKWTIIIFEKCRLSISSISDPNESRIHGNVLPAAAPVSNICGTVQSFRSERKMVFAGSCTGTLETKLHAEGSH